jgi:hypothetical protein
MILRARVGLSGEQSYSGWANSRAPCGADEIASGRALLQRQPIHFLRD